MANKSKKPTFRISRTLFYGCLAGGVVLFGIHLLICALTDAKPLISGIALLLVYGALIPAGVMLDRARLTRQAEKEAELPALGNMMLEMLGKIDAPYLITDEAGGIIWYNRALLALSGRRDSLYGLSTDDFFPIRMADLIRDEREDGVPGANKEVALSAYSSDLYAACIISSLFIA